MQVEEKKDNYRNQNNILLNKYDYLVQHYNKLKKKLQISNLLLKVLNIVNNSRKLKS